MGFTSECRTYYLMRIDTGGNLLGPIWEQEFGPRCSQVGVQWLFDIETTRDGGFIVGGLSSNPPSGNKTNPNFGSWDFWVLKLLPERAHLQLLPTNQTERVHFLLQTSYFGNYAVDRSVDLANWNPWQTNTFTGVTPEIVDRDTNWASQLFYRARRLP